MHQECGLKSNKRKKVYYISPYLPQGGKFENHYSPAAQTKVGYVRTKLGEYDTTTVCVNCSLTVDNSIFLPKRIKDKNGEMRVLLSLSSRYRFLLPLCGAIMLMSVFCFVLFHIGKNDTVFLYHSIYYDKIVTTLKKIKHFRIIYEVEEIYADVRNGGAGREAEIAACEQSADGFIFPTELLDEIVNKNKKRSIIIYGAYQPVSTKRSNKEVTTIVYSGTLMKGKGAQEAINCASALDERFEVRIIGYGSEEEIKIIQKMIKKNSSGCKAFYDGMKLGDEYIHYLANCDIGICVQPNESLFNGSSFPSKILSYFNNGLKVVASEMESLKRSKVGEYIFFSTSVDPIEVAKAIKKAKESNVDNTDVLQRLDAEVAENIKTIMSN